MEGKLGEQIPIRRETSGSAEGQVRVDVAVANLEHAIRQSKMTQAEISRLSKVNRKTIAGWLRSGRASLPHLRAVADVLDAHVAFHCSVDFLRGVELKGGKSNSNSADVRRIDGVYEISSGRAALPANTDASEPVPVAEGSGRAADKQQVVGKIELSHDKDDPQRIIGTGIDTEHAEIHFDGTLHDNLTICGTYKILNERMTLVGVIRAHVSHNGASIKGKYLRGGSGHNSHPEGDVVGELILNLILDNDES